MEDIWLNEGFATYAEWLWLERRGIVTAQQVFRDLASIPASDPLWHLAIGDPGADALFEGAVYVRGAMTLHRLRQRVGDVDFFRILRRWHQSNAGGNVATPQFVRHAERVSGENLDRLFHDWLFTATKPPVPGDRGGDGGRAGAGDNERRRPMGRQQRSSGSWPTATPVEAWCACDSKPASPRVRPACGRVRRPR